MVPKGRVGWYHPVDWQLPENTRLLMGGVSVLCIRPWCRMSTYLGFLGGCGGRAPSEGLGDGGGGGGVGLVGDEGGLGGWGMGYSYLLLFLLLVRLLWLLRCFGFRRGGRMGLRYLGTM